MGDLRAGLRQGQRGLAAAWLCCSLCGGRRRGCGWVSSRARGLHRWGGCPHWGGWPHSRGLASGVVVVWSFAWMAARLAPLLCIRRAVSSGVALAVRFVGHSAAGAFTWACAAASPSGYRGCACPHQAIAGLRGVHDCMTGSAHRLVRRGASVSRGRGAWHSGQTQLPCASVGVARARGVGMLSFGFTGGGIIVSLGFGRLA